jgi:toxin YoeB
LEFLDNSWEEYQDLTAKDKKSCAKIVQLLQSIDRDGEGQGIGHPEPLRANLSGKWSRDIDKKNRLVYRVSDDGIIKLYEVGSHYGDK